MSSFGTKKTQQQFSTTEIQECRSYSSRFSRSRPKKVEVINTLPYNKQKSAVKIQKWWRLRMSMRRKFYERLLEQLYYENTVMRDMINYKQKYVQGIKRQIASKQSIVRLQIQKETRKQKEEMKKLAKDCVGVTFKMQKRMISDKQLQKGNEEKNVIVENMLRLKEKKRELEEQVVERGSKCEQLYLKQIKQGNSQLLRIVRERNSLKQQIKQKAIDNNLI